MNCIVVEPLEKTYPQITPIPQIPVKQTALEFFLLIRSYLRNRRNLRIACIFAAD
jgi:hypothetical protein